MGNLKIKENVDLDNILPELGFIKAKDYFHCENISIKIDTREVMISVTTPGARYSTLRRFPITKPIIKLIEKGLVE